MNGSLRMRLVFGMLAALFALAVIATNSARVAAAAWMQDDSEATVISSDVPRQPLLAQMHRLLEATEVLGTPFSEQDVEGIEALKDETDDEAVVKGVQAILDPKCIAVVEIQETGRPKVIAGEAKPVLLEQGWKTYLIKVINQPGRIGRLLIESPNSAPIPHSPANLVESRWMQLASFEGQPMRADLSGLLIEYRLVQIYSRNAGERTGILQFAFGSTEGPEGLIIRGWRFDEGSDGWVDANQAESKAEKGSLVITSKGNDPYLMADVEREGGGLMTLRFWAETKNGGNGQVFWQTTQQPQSHPSRQRSFQLEPNKAKVYEVPFFVEGDLKGLRLDPLMSAGEIRIDWIDLVSNRRADNWTSIQLDFDARPATRLTFNVRDAYGEPGFARFVIRDQNGQVYPAQSKRLAPDFFFHSQIYRGDGESIALPAGTYTVECSRGPESIPELKQIVVGDDPVELSYQVKRWIDPSKSGWWSGDHHIHAAGCAHYENPTQGVAPEDMIRHIMGEDLKVGCCLTWGPCFDFQKRFFTGDVHEKSQYPYILRYDVEVSGFGSHMSGHLNLLNLTEQIYPGGESKDHWPTLGLNTLRWAKRQGAICGPAHSGLGLGRFIGRVPGTEGKDGPGGLPTFNIPAYDGIGANEFVVDVTHEVPGPSGEPTRAVDFISAMDTDRTAEWNMWYHVLNCGVNVVVSGETDFPCISGDRVGMGRVYAEVEGELTFAKWVQALSDGRSYVSDGKCHLPGFVANAKDSEQQVAMGVDGSTLNIGAPATIQFDVTAAARLRQSGPTTVELIVNGYPVESKLLAADGEIRELSFETEIEKSSWVAVRVFPHAHSNPIFVKVGGKPVRASLDSARWCLMGVEQCWNSKQPTYAAAEQEDAREAYDHAREFYQAIIDELK